MPASLLLLVATLLATSPELEDGRIAYSRLKYAKAIQQLTPLSTSAGAPTAERIEALDLIARSHLALGHTAAAEKAYDALLALDPMAAEPAGSPKVRGAFDRARKHRFPPTYVELKRVVSAPDVLELTVVNPWRLLVTVELWESVVGEFTRREVPLEGTRAVAALKPGTRNYVRVVDGSGAVLARLGEDAPFPGPTAVALAGPPPPVPAPEPPPLARAPDAPKKVTLTPSAAPRTVPVKPKAAPANGHRPLALTLMGVGVAMVLVGVVGIVTDTSPLHLRDADEISTLYENLDPWILTWSGVSIVGACVTAIGGLILGWDWLNKPGGLSLIM